METPHTSTVEAQLAATRLRNTRIIAWLIFGSKVLSLLSAAAAEGVPPEARAVFMWIRVPDLFINFLIVLAIQLTAPIPPILRLLLLYSVTFIVLAEAMITKPLSGWAFSWVNFTAAMGSIIAFDPVKERRYALAAILGCYILTILGVFLYPRVSFMEANAITHGLPRYVLITVLVGIAGFLVFNHHGKLVSDAMRFAEQLREISHTQQVLAEEALHQKTLAEKRQAEAEAALAEVARLRELDRQRAEQQRFLMRYETLMRESYTISLTDFGRKLLESLSEELPVLGGLLYHRQNEQWQVQADCAFPLEEGQLVRSGLLDMVAGLKAVYLLTPAPAGTKRPHAGLHTPAPSAILYLPLYSEATGETVVIVELLLSEAPSTERLLILQELLPRLGTYMWIRSERDRAFAA